MVVSPCLDCQAQRRAGIDAQMKAELYGRRGTEREGRPTRAERKAENKRRWNAGERW